MPGLVPGIHVFAALERRADDRDKPGHDVGTAAAAAGLLHDRRQVLKIRDLALS
jgi:hypothetical protein